MLNYEKMDEVIDDLGKCAENLQELSAIQEKFDEALGQLSETVKEIGNERESVERIQSAFEDVQNTYRSIDANIATVLQDYKKLHSAFEYIELELKKNDSALREMHDGLEKSLREIQDGQAQAAAAGKELQAELKNELAGTKRRSKITMSSVFAGIGLSVACLVLSIVALLI